MPNYDLNRLGDKEFERLCQSLLKEVVGSGTITFGEGPDGGREATFTGKAPYPSDTEAWDGEWIFQAKFHDIQRIGPDKARQQVLADLRAELDKTVNKYKRKCDNYILITNVPLSSVHERGTHDRIAAEVVPEFLDRVPHIHVWGADDVCRLLEKYPNVRQSYLHFLTPGDLIAEVMNYQVGEVSRLAETIRLYMTTSFSREQYAQLDQAGEVGEERMPLQKVFIDLDVQARQPEDLKRFVFKESSLFDMRIRSDLVERESIPAMRVLLSEELPKIVLIGGPGQGKSTLGQYLAQVHRATLLNRLSELNGDRVDLTPLVARIPFRILLREYAQWLTETDSSDGLEFYLSERVQERAGRHVSADEIQAVFRQNPCLLILDGLDEVTERNLQARMLDRIGEFLDRCENVLQADLQVLATSRPTGYSDQCDPSRFLHLRLTRLTSEKVNEYVAKWSKANLLDRPKAQQLAQSVQDCLDDSQIRLLMNTPLQVTILILIILSGGTPPRQREALFDEYLEVIYKREKAKAKAIIQTEKQLLFGLHQYLGYVLHSRAGEARDVRSVLEETEFIKEVRTYLRFNDPFSDDKTLDEQVDLIVREARERLVLIVELKQDLFGFEMRSLQEFFTAAHLADTAKDTKQRYERFEAIARPSHWRNVTLFFAGRVGRVYSGEAANILEVCKDIDRHKPDLFLRRGAWLALELAADRSFGPNRRLQRSIIEYGLTLVDIKSDGESVHHLRTILRKLPGEDIRDHILHVLKAKISSLAMPYLETAIDLYQAFDPSSEFLLEVIDTLLHSSVQRNILFAFKKCVEFESDPDWTGHRLRQHLDNVPPKEFAEIFAKKSLDNLRYVQLCLAHWAADDKQVAALLDHVFLIAAPWLYFPKEGPPDPKEFLFDLSTPTTQMLSTFYLLGLLRTVRRSRRDYHPSRRFLLRAGEIVDCRLPDPDNYLQAREQLLESLAPVAELLKRSEPDHLVHQQPKLLPHLEGCLWLVRFAVDSRILDLLEAFVDFYNSVRVQHPSLSDFLRQYGETAHPLLPLLLKAADSGSLESVENACHLIATFNDPHGTRLWYRIRDYLEKDVASLSEHQVAQVALWGPSVLVNEPEKRQLGIELESMLGVRLQHLISYMRIGSKVQELTLEADQILVILDQVREAVETTSDPQNWLWTIQALCWMRWSFDDQVAHNCEKLLSLLLGKAETDPKTVGRAASTLFLKLFDVGLPSEVVMVPVLNDLGRLEDAEFAIPFFFKPTPGQANSTLAYLESYLRHSRSEVRRGAARLMGTIVHNVLAYSPTRRHPLPEAYRLSINWETALDLVEGKDHELKTIGIKLLVFSSFPIESASDRLLAAMERCNDAQEAEVWSTFVRNARLTNGSECLPAWIDFFEVVLETSHLMPAIRKAALSGYGNLVTSEVIDGHKLGLPLSHEGQ